MKLSFPILAGATCLAFLLALMPSPVLADVVIDGVNADIAKAIRANLTLPDGCGQSDWLVRYRYRNSKQEIETTLQTFGYFSPTVTQQLAFDPKCWTATFHVDPGQQARIASAHLAIEGEGKSLPAFAEIIEKTNLKVGNKFDPDAWDVTKSDIESLASRLGFRDGKFVQHAANVDAKKNTVDVELVYDTGPRYHFGKTIFSTDALDDALLRRYVPYAEGDPFDGQQLGVLYRSLLDSGYFDDVLIDTSHVTGTTVEVRVSLVTGKKSKSHIGVGFSTDLGPSLTIGHNVRLVNRRGHQLNGDLSLSPVQTKFAGYYRMPRSEDKGSWVSIYGGFLEEQTATSKTSKTTFGVRRVLPRANGWVETRFLEVTNDRFDVAGESNSTLAIAPGINFAHTQTDNVSARPMHAHTFMVEFSGTSRSFGSTVDYFSSTASAKFIHPVIGDIRFIGRGRVGAVFSSDFDSLPPGVRYFSGGDDSVRGFDYHEIGAIAANGETVGGDRVIEGSTEFDYGFTPHWAVATFFDAGSVSLSHFSATFERSVGIGVRWYSPIGPVRLDLAQPLDSPNRGVKLHISLGPDL